MGEFRTKSQTLTKETTECIADYLKHRDAYSKPANNLQNSLSQSVSKGKNGSVSQGRLFETVEVAESNNTRTRNNA